MSAVTERIPLSADQERALAPVRDWLLESARADGRALLQAAGEEAGARLTRARAEAADLVESARAEGETQGAEAAARVLSRARREARSAVLQAQADLQSLLRDRARTAASDLRADPGYPGLRDRLAERARNALGPGATITDAPAGGVEAHDGSRRVDLSLPTLADQALATLGEEVSRLWT